MIVESITLNNVRNHESFSCHFSPGTTVIYGPNGAGKTTVLEAIHSIFQGSSFKGSDGDMLRSGADWYRMEMMTDRDRRSVGFSLDIDRPKKKIDIDGVVSTRMLGKHRYPVVVFSPDDLRLLSGSPSRRRQYLDRIITQITPSYGSVVRQYERSVTQRNKLLKTARSVDELFPWDVLIGERGANIIAARVAMINTINEQIQTTYPLVAQKMDDIKVAYSHQDQFSPQQIIYQLHSAFERDTQLGYTTVGPHRHDMVVTMRGGLAATTASRGENRTIILALKQSETDLIIERTKNTPIILLDDVFGELDDARRQQVIELFSGMQTIITSTHQFERFADSEISL